MGSEMCIRDRVCALAICLLWMSSLSATRYLVASAIVSPPLAAVAAECERLYAEVDRQRKGHASCARVQLEQCDARLGGSAAAEEARTARAAAANTRLLRSASTIRKQCTFARAHALAVLRTLERRGLMLQWSGTACSADDIRSAQALVRTLPGYAIDVHTCRVGSTRPLARSA